jgi:predicted glycosyltransferase
MGEELVKELLGGGDAGCEIDDAVLVKAEASHALESSTVIVTGPGWPSRQVCTVAARAAVQAW